MKQYETIHERCEEYDRERKENMKLHTKGMKSMTEKEKRIRNRMKLHMKVVKNMTEKEKRT